MLKTYVVAAFALILSITVYNLPVEAKSSGSISVKTSTFRKITTKHISKSKILIVKKQRVTLQKPKKSRNAKKISRNAQKTKVAAISKTPKSTKSLPSTVVRLAKTSPKKRPVIVLRPASGTGKWQVMALISDMAPRYGVPTWFALRIAKIESGYNPNARGKAGEIGIFQLKCSTAKGIGYTGGCEGLYNAGANVRYGLKHLSLAIRKSGGNLKLAASKHNGGLGRKSLVQKYVNRVF